MKIGIKKGSIVFLTFFLIGCFFITPSVVYAQKNTYTVQKGDTLWDICEKYYGDPNLWPELWQMNPFITNPHLLKPGDVITLFEKKPEKEVKGPEMVQPEEPVEEPTEKAEAEAAPKVMGLDLSGLTDLRTIGFFSKGAIQSWGTIIASDNNKLILDKNDTIYILFDKDRQILAGDEFAVGEISPLLRHPVTNQELGYTFSVRAKLVVEKKRGLGIKNNEFYTKENVYQAKIIEIFKPIYIKDVVMPSQTVSSCVLPVHYEKDLLTNIVAAKDQEILLHTNSIVYLDSGFNDGINRGNVFQVVKGQILDDPKPDSDARWELKSKIILPDITLGMIMVLESRPDTATAIVLKALESFSTGAYITNAPWQDVRKLLTTKPACPME